MKINILFIIVFLCIVVPTLSAILTTNACENTQLAINCPIGYKITIKDAFYGRRNKLTCPCANLCTNTNCAFNSTSILVARCEGKQSCTIDSSNAIFGEPCTTTYKYLQVSYECVQNTFTNTACESTQLLIYCPVYTFIVIKDALFGRTNRSVCPCLSDTCYDDDTNCASSSTTSVLVSRCEGKQTCIVPAAYEVFGDPCPGIYKYLQATYECVQNSPTQLGLVGVNTCERNQLSISCPFDYNIVIRDAFFGRKSTSICPCADLCSKTNCAFNSTSILVSRCGGKQSCILNATTTIFGEPCTATYKYLNTNYRCVINSLTQRPIITKNACESKQLAINCPSNQYIVIQESFYGRRDRSICPCLSDTCYDDDTNCAINSTSVLVSSCAGKQSCTVDAVNEIFDDPCPGIYKYLQVSYKCVPKSI